jgi:hypothetical protein
MSAKRHHAQPRTIVNQRRNLRRPKLAALTHGYGQQGRPMRETRDAMLAMDHKTAYCQVIEESVGDSLLRSSCPMRSASSRQISFRENGKRGFNKNRPVTQGRRCSEDHSGAELLSASQYLGVDALLGQHLDEATSALFGCSAQQDLCAARAELPH